MKQIHIKQKLENLGISINELVLGDYDFIGRFTAEKQRAKNDPLYSSVGCFFRPNLERGLLISSLIKQYNITSMLEIGFGRGYTTFCVAKLFYELGINGKITTVDPDISEEKLGIFQQVFPKEWFNYINFIKGFSNDVIPTLTEQFGLTYIDGDHSYEATKNDWLLSKDKTTHVTVFDDYHLPTKLDAGIQCARAIDEIDWMSEGYSEPELIIADRRIFVDDRGFSDDKIDYGQVVLTRNGVSTALDW